jgi:hypothetical protein
MVRCGGAQKLAEHLCMPYAEMRGRPPRDRQRHGDPLSRAQLAARLRAPPGTALEPGSGGAAVGGPAGGGRAAAGEPRSHRPHRPQGPSSRLLERELVLEAYQDFTLV